MDERFAGDWIPLGPPASTVDVAGSVVALLTTAVPGTAGEIEVYDLSDPVSVPTAHPTRSRRRPSSSSAITSWRFEHRRRSKGRTSTVTASGRPRPSGLRSGQSPASSTRSQTAIPCPLEACDPRVPYRVSGDTVTFITAEADQGRDLNGDDDKADLVKQVFNAREAADAAGTAGDSSRPIASASKGVCSDTGAACSSDAECMDAGSPTAVCFLPPGRCHPQPRYRLQSPRPVSVATGCSLNCGYGFSCQATGSDERVSVTRSGLVLQSGELPRV